ncbi:hypothetical protein V2J09_017377 [Rumex salicifolius]
MGSVRALGLLGALLLVQNVAATQFTVGGSSGWVVPSDNGAAYNQWAERMRFQIVFAYPSSSDSVLRVTKDDFTNCNTASALEKYTDGHTVVTLSDSGPHYFISGNKANCQKNEKIVVVVLADRTMKTAAPSPAPSTAPPPAPPTETPSPSPAATTTTDGSPPSPPPEASSTPAPTQQDNHNGVSLIDSWRVLIGVFAGSAAVLAAL